MATIAMDVITVTRTAQRVVVLGREEGDMNCSKI
jgi:hypothetical protein